MKKLPESVNRFQIGDIEGVITKRKFTGSFEAKIPNLRMQAQVSKHRATLNGGPEDELDLGTRNLHHMIAYLKVCLEDYPKWWKDEDFGYELFDINVVEHVYNLAVKYENEWIEACWGDDKDDKKDEKEEAKA